ncbi:methylmalonyl Co-A mutase-associated GTPase MeaB [bacterium]|nr:methylmalonyl Co-A mutase-associated GTPase MeaB [candidate division CSSED10-310 bacterium]
MEQFVIADELWQRFFVGDRLACARIITYVDNHPDRIPAILDRLFPHLKNATRVGITGPPGVGKSTITAALARQASQNGKKVGIIAVDPTSPFSGGAFLGDRIRMQNLIGDSNVFIRSLASRSGGGLSPSTPYVADVFDGFGMDLILIETVGVGQAELDILSCSDIIMLVLQPSTGDVIQMLKAGIMETADLYVINKSDLPGSDQLADYIQFIFQTSSHYSVDNYPPVIKASALKETNIDCVFDILVERIRQLNDTGKILRKRQDRMILEIEKAIRAYLWITYLKNSGVSEDIRKTAIGLVHQGQSPFQYIESLCKNICLTIDQPAHLNPENVNQVGESE